MPVPGGTTQQAVVYKARNLVNGHSYIGYTSRGLAAREWEHRAYARKGGGYLLQRAIRKHGQENFVFEILMDFKDDEELAKVFEQEAIAAWRPEYNILAGGEGNPVTDEWRQKLRAANLGKKASFATLEKMRVAHTGRAHNAETRAKIAAIRRGVPRKPETVAKMRAAMLGRPAPRPAGWKHTPEAIAKLTGRVPSEETRRKISEAKKGVPGPTKGLKFSDVARAHMRDAASKRVFVNTDAHIAAAQKNITKAAAALRKSVVCLDTGQIFDSAVSADRCYNFPKRTVAKRIKKGQKARGLRFVYLSEQ